MHLSPGAFALVAMGAVFGAASRAAFTFIIFAFEITRDYNSVLPLMLVAVIADGVAMLFMPGSSIMTEKLARRGLRVHQDYEADVLTQATVGDTMERDAPVVTADTKVGELAERIARHDPAVARHEALLILDGAGRLAGIITRGDILRALDKDSSGAETVQEAGSTHLVVTYPDELVSEAAAKLLGLILGGCRWWSAETSEKWWDTGDGLRCWPRGCCGFRMNMCGKRDGLAGLQSERTESLSG